MNLSVAAIARVETGSLTPTLSRGERVSHIPHGDMPELQPSEPSRPVPANTRPNPSKPAGNILPLPPGEGRGEGRSLHSSLHGSWSQCVSNFWKTFLSMNRASVAAGVPPAVEGGVSPPGIPGSWPVSRSFLNRGLPMNLSRQAIARVDTGSLTPTLSQGEREKNRSHRMKCAPHFQADTTELALPGRRCRPLQGGRRSGTQSAKPGGVPSHQGVGAGMSQTGSTSTLLKSAGDTISRYSMSGE